jgi:glycosyltransferase involved in cell wall biosynthesis
VLSRNPVPTRLAVVVPAHNEERLLPGCLRALAAARAAVPAVRVDVFVVLDACTDRTAGIARAAGVRQVRLDARNVGRARAAGVLAAVRAGVDGLWLASTDADSRVPPDWLRAQCRYAAAGAQVLAGTVRVADWTGWAAETRRAYERRYAMRPHEHVHGANLGCLAEAYLAIGGFPPLHTGEDRALVAAARAAGLDVRHATDLPVATSARRRSRVRAGFAGHLRGLADAARSRPG